MIRFLILCPFVLLGCTDAAFSKLTNFGGSATVRCYSGGTLIYEGKSTGKVISEAQSDGYAFRDAADRKLKEVSGDCIIDYGE
jgi:hypothetical protein